MSDNAPCVPSVFWLDQTDDLNIEELQHQPSWQSRYKVLVTWGNRVEPKPTIRTPLNRVKGCDANVWLIHCCDADIHRFAVDSDARIIKGLAALLLVQFNGRSRQEIEAVNVDELLRELDLAKHLSPSRANGFNALLQRMLFLVAQ